jgi:pimeloyl-ACP methyl ester carboxylesterase
MDDAGKDTRDWARVAAASVAAHQEAVVVVAHSRGGMALPLVPEFVRVRRLVALAALLPQPGMSFRSYLDTEDGRDALLAPPLRAEAGEAVRGEGTTWRAFRRYFAPDCAEARARWAWEQLRPSPFAAYLVATPLAAWPALPTTSIVMLEDRIVNPIWSRRVAARIAADVVELPGGHCPMLADPERLATTLASLAS